MVDMETKEERRLRLGREKQKRWRMANPEKYRRKNREAAKRWRERHPELHRERSRAGMKKYLSKPENVIKYRESTRTHVRRIRKKAHEILGGICVKCGFDHPLAMQIDHINNDGYKDKRPRQTIHRFIIKDTEAAKKEFQLLCANCNTIKAHESGSYHRSRRNKAT